jgi:hypothetical protein
MHQDQILVSEETRNWMSRMCFCLFSFIYSRCMLELREYLLYELVIKSCKQKRSSFANSAFAGDQPILSAANLWRQERDTLDSLIDGDVGFNRHQCRWNFMLVAFLVSQILQANTNWGSYKFSNSGCNKSSDHPRRQEWSYDEVMLVLRPQSYPNQ